VLVGIEPSNFRHRAWRRILKRADIGPRAIKDRRDTVASQLLTAGVQLGYVSQQLGRADVSVTARPVGTRSQVNGTP
jgi:integrase